MHVNIVYPYPFPCSSIFIPGIGIRNGANPQCTPVKPYVSPFFQLVTLYKVTSMEVAVGGVVPIRPDNDSKVYLIGPF